MKTEGHLNALAFILVGLPSLKVGAAITTIIGLLGFTVACVFLMYLARTRAQTKRLGLLPSGDRAIAIDDYLSRYGMTVENLTREQRYDLVMREMNLRFRKQLGLSALGATVFVACFTIVAFGPREPGVGPHGRTPADDLVNSYQDEIMILRGEFEAVDRNPTARDRVQTEGVRLANLIAGVQEGRLSGARRIIRYEYQGWALLMVARTYSRSDPQEKAKLTEYAAEAIRAFDDAIAEMSRIRTKYQEGDKEGAIIYEWMMTKSMDFPRTLYLKAIALAVLAEVGGGHTKQEVKDLLAAIPPEYLREYPISNNPDLKWATSS